MKVHIARNIMIKWQGSRLYTVNARKKKAVTGNQILCNR